MKLTDRAVSALAPGELLTDSIVTGLMAEGTRKGAKFVLRFVSPVTGKRRSAGVGSYPDVTLAKARERAQAMRSQIADGIDPIEARDTERAAGEQASAVPTFGAAAKQAHTDLSAGWKAGKNVQRWLTSVEQHLAPLLERRVDTLTPRDFADALRAQWIEHPRAAADVLQRASIIMRWAFASNYASGDPTSLVRSLLPKQTTRVVHHPAMLWRDVPAFVTAHLANIEPTDVVRAAVFVLMHTACRPSEARAATWTEFDLDEARWTIPAERMKGKLTHVVPLPVEVVDLLRAMHEAPLHDDFVFPNSQGRNAISDVRMQEFMQDAKATSDTEGRFAVPHGCRATFRNWCMDTRRDEAAAERQLAHRPRGETAAAYMRSDRFDARRELLAQWADHLHGRTANNVLPFESAA
jgi:integrase